MFPIDSFFINFPLVYQVTILCLGPRCLFVSQCGESTPSVLSLATRWYSDRLWYLFTARVKGNINLCLNRRASGYGFRGCYILNFTIIYLFLILIQWVFMQEKENRTVRAHYISEINKIRLSLWVVPLISSRQICQDSRIRRSVKGKTWKKLLSDF